MKKILFLNGNMNTGGVERALLNILKNLDYSKYSVDLLLLEEIGDYETEIPEQVHIILHSLNKAYGPFIKCVIERFFERDWQSICIRFLLLAKKLLGTRTYPGLTKLFLQDRQYDTVVAFRHGICAELAAYGIKSEKKILWWHHGEVNMGQQERDMFSKLCSRFYCTVVPSEGCIQMLQKEIGQHLYLKIPNMIDVAEIQRKTENTFLYGRNAPDIKIIISVSMIAPEKHFENVIYAVQYLLEKGVQNFRWHIVGGGWDFAKIYAMIQEKHLERYIIMEGIQADPYPYMKGAYLFVHPSYVESQGIAIGEAMALGVPCVVTRSLGPCEFIQDGVNGVLTEQDPISLAKKVEQMLTDPELYARIKENTHCPRQFLPEQVMEQIGGLLG